MITKEQHTALIDAIISLQVLGELAERIGDVGGGEKLRRSARLLGQLDWLQGR